MIGNLRHRIELQTQSVARTSFAGKTTTYATIATVWASIEPLRGKEVILAQQNQSEQTHRVTIRYRAGVNTSMRFKFGSRIMRIISVANVEERNKWLELQCVEMGVDQ
jgi:SPP1 family predicted phage head-tail adaptor